MRISNGNDCSSGGDVMLLERDLDDENNYEDEDEDVIYTTYLIL